jgi:intermediate filament protein if
VRTTTYESSTSHSSQGPEYQKNYRSFMGPRSVVINRSGPVQQMSRSQMQSMQMAPSISAGAYAAVTQTGVGVVKVARVQEKKDMQDLNERFASYIEKVRFLEAQNRKLADELDKLKSKWGKETTAIKAMYQAELDEARRLLDDAEKEKARLEIRVDSLEQELEESRNKCEEVQATRQADRETIDRQNQQLCDYEAEINLLRKRVEQLESDREKDKKEIARLTDLLNRARIDLDNETLAHIDAENRRQTLEEELEFLKQVHEQEMKELAALAYRDTTAENREFWKNEMGAALREIQMCYDEKMDTMRGELEGYYNMKIQEFRTGATRQNMETVHSKEESKRLRSQLADLRAKLGDMESRNAQLEKELELLRREYSEKEREWETENTELKNEVAKLRAEMEAILKELQDIMDTKLGLELEIAAYRKLLEGEENRVGLRQVVESIVATQEQRMLTAETLYSVRQTEQTSGGTD